MRNFAWRFRQQIDITRQILPIVLYLTTSTAAITVAGALNLNALSVAFGVFLMLLSLYFLLLAPLLQIVKKHVGKRRIGDVGRGGLPEATRRHHFRREDRFHILLLLPRVS